MTDDRALLAAYVCDGSQPAFSRVVERHLGLVLAAALRQVGGDAALAQDVAQAVFTDCARKAAALREHRNLAGWLYTATRHAAAHALRAEQRRRQRETAAHALMNDDNTPADSAADWERLRPWIDECLGELSARERDALVLRFFSGRSFPELAADLAVTESGARMRVERALEKLRARLGRRGFHSTAATLGAALAAPAFATPPAGLAAAISQSALAASAAGGGTTALLGFLGMTKLQLSAVCAAALVSAGYITHEWHTAQSRPAAPSRPAAVSVSAASTATPARAPQLDAVPADVAPDPETAALRATLAAEQQHLARLQTARSRASVARARPTVSPRTGAPVVAEQELETLPKAAQTTAPKFPRALQTAGIPGEAIMEVLVDADGTVLSVEPEDATHPDFALAAAEALQKWTFSPGVARGQPVATLIRIPIRFKIEQPNWF